MTKNAQKKGSDLEKAIALIENAILKAAPGLSDKSYQIFSRKIIIVDGVKHEIDIWVEFDMGGGYKSIFIFEAKNWNKPVGKNEPIIFSEKIKAAQAQQGFLVGKEFSRYAVAAAKNDSRIELLKASDAFPLNNAIGDLVGRFHHLGTDRSKMHVNVELLARANSEPLPNPVDIRTTVSTINGVIVDIQNYALEHANRLVEAHNNRLPTHTFADGVYKYTLSDEILFDEDRLLINNTEIAKIKLQIAYEIEVVRPPIVSQFEIDTRGRVYNLGAVTTGGATSQVSFIEIFKR